MSEELKNDNKLLWDEYRYLRMEFGLVLAVIDYIHTNKGVHLLGNIRCRKDAFNYIATYNENVIKINKLRLSQKIKTRFSIIPPLIKFFILDQDSMGDIDGSIESLKKRRHIKLFGIFLPVDIYEFL